MRLTVPTRDASQRLALERLPELPELPRRRSHRARARLAGIGRQLFDLPPELPLRRDHLDDGVLRGEIALGRPHPDTHDETQSVEVAASRWSRGPSLPLHSCRRDECRGRSPGRRIRTCARSRPPRVPLCGAAHGVEPPILRLACSPSITVNSQSSPSEAASFARRSQPSSPAPPARIVSCTVKIVPSGRFRMRCGPASLKLKQSVGHFSGSFLLRSVLRVVSEVGRLDLLETAAAIFGWVTSGIG